MIKTKRKIIRRHINADYYDEARLRRISKEGKLLYKRRKETIERSFADSKQNHGYRYARYRGKAKSTVVRLAVLLRSKYENNSIKRGINPLNTTKYY